MQKILRIQIILILKFLGECLTEEDRPKIMSNRNPKWFLILKNSIREILSILHMLDSATVALNFGLHLFLKTYVGVGEGGWPSFSASN